MLNIDNIGQRIKMLRKQNRISQERMAEDLGMYQADISNLERGKSGSGITDLDKIDRIADYFNVPLTYLLLGYSELNGMASGQKISEVENMNNYIISNAQYDYVKTDNKENVRVFPYAQAFISEVRLISPDNRAIYYSFTEHNDKPCFFRSKDSLFDELISACKRHEEINRIERKHCILAGEDYIDIFENAESKLLPVLRYLIYIATEDEDEADLFIQNTKGKKLYDIKVPISSREPEELFDVNYSDLANVYRYRLMLEASVKNPSVYSAFENTLKREKALLEKLKKACESEEAYKVWKKDLIDAKIREVIEKEKIVTCSYVFAGIGQYKEIMPEEMVESFIQWINMNGSAVFAGCRPATKREIRTYVSQHIADELLGIG